MILGEHIRTSLSVVEIAPDTLVVPDGVHRNINRVLPCLETFVAAGCTDILADEHLQVFAATVTTAIRRKGHGIAS
jgi:hypothetical protein